MGRSYLLAHWKHGRWRQALLMHMLSLPRGLRQRLFAGNRRHCPLCESNLSMFLPHGVRMRRNARCPICGSLERHRFTWIYMALHPELLSGGKKRVLHIAPEEGCLGDRIRSVPGVEYLSAGLNDPLAMVQMDLTNAPFADNSMDVVLCNHVLEHIPDDRRAMGELYRIVRPGGWVLIQVPLASHPTREDPSVSDPWERERLFGQHDHVRIYGPDIKIRLEKAGFAVEPVLDSSVVEEPERVRLGIELGETIFVCRK